MHYHLEVIIPPNENFDGIKSALSRILEPFNENGKDEEGNRNRHGFWDFWLIGGRWSGTKLESAIDPERKEEFFRELSNRKLTVSGFQAGKQSLQPTSQIPMVDALWREFFPESPLKVCPFFAHFNDQYKDSEGFPDIMKLGDVPKSLKASRVIIAGPSGDDDGTLQANYMVQDSMWNGVNHVDSKWDRSLWFCIDEYREELKNADPDYAEKNVPKDDWLVVTVDYHS